MDLNARRASEIPGCVTRGLDHASRIYPTCALKVPEIG
jgi:hypothetical protein